MNRDDTSNETEDQPSAAVTPPLARDFSAHSGKTTRDVSGDDLATPRPYYVVWEITRHCDQPCEHCGSRAGPKLANELSTDEVVAVARQLVRLGCRECVLIGGEAYLRKDLPLVIAELVKGGVRTIMQTGGRNFTREKARMYRRAGMSQLGVSIDGPAEIHDRLRNNRGSYDAAIAALDNARAEGLIVSINTQINRLNYKHIESFAEVVRAAGSQSWQVQLTVPMGEAADRPEWLLQPHHIIDVVDALARVQRKALEEHTGDGPPFNVVPNNNIGYFGPHEELLRSRPGSTSGHWRGCMAGIAVFSVEADGNVKACPSLPTAPYVGGNVREMTVEHLWNHSERIRFARDRDTSEMWGRCKDCYYADTCRGGCSFMTHCLFGKRGNNPFCYYRATKLKREGLRERLVQVQRPPGEFYDYGRFEIVDEAWDAKPPPAARRLPLLVD